MIVLTIVLVLVSFIIGWHFFMGYPGLIENLPSLGRRGYVIVQAVGEVLFPPEGAIPYSYYDAGVVEYIDRYIGGLSKRHRILIKALFFMMEYGTWAVFFSVRRLSRLNLEDRVKYFGGWEGSRIYFRRVAYISLRTIYGLAYLAHPEIIEYIGYYNPKGCVKKRIGNCE